MTNDDRTYKSMYKYEIAEIIGVSTKTLSRWLKLTFGNEIKGKHLLNPNEVRKIYEHYCIDYR